jgi:hypothetical protein
MIFYHGTNKHGWNETLKQGYLLHKRATKMFPNMSPCIYLATNIEEAKQYGDIILEVEYNPMVNPSKNNYQPDGWQLRVYEPIYKFKRL